MAAAFDAISYSGWSNGVSSFNWTHTPVGTPTSALVIVRKTRPSDTTSVTYGGTNMTLESSVISGNDELEFWVLGNPASGAQSVVVSASGTTYRAFCHALTFIGSNTNTTDGFTGFTGNSGTTGTTNARTVTSATDDLVVDGITVFCEPGQAQDFTPGAGQTERADVSEATDEDHGAVSTEAGAASVSMDQTWTTATNLRVWLHAGVNVVQAAAAAATYPGADGCGVW